MRCQTPQLSATFLAVFRTGTGGFKKADIGFKVITKCGALVLSRGILTSRYHLCFDKLGAAFEIGEHSPGRLLISAARRHSLHNAPPVAVLGDIERGFEGDTLCAVLARRYRRRAGLALAVLPTGQALPFTNEGFRAGWQRLSELLFEHAAHRLTYPFASLAIPDRNRRRAGPPCRAEETASHARTA
jgi:hypothetical protein